MTRLFAERMSYSLVALSTADMNRDDRHEPQRPLHGQRRGRENRGEPGREHSTIPRRGLGLLLVGILLTSVFLTTQILFSLFKSMQKGQQRRKK